MIKSETTSQTYLLDQSNIFAWIRVNKYCDYDAKDEFHDLHFLLNFVKSGAVQIDLDKLNVAVMYLSF